jgi:uncharacterized protein
VTSSRVGGERGGTVGHVSDLATRLREVAPSAFADEPIAFAYLFGSSAGGSRAPRSDIDVAVRPVPGAPVDDVELRLRLARALETVLGTGPVEVVVLDEENLSLAGRVLETGALIFSADDVARVRYASRISRMYHDFKVHEQRSAAERLARLANGR